MKGKNRARRRAKEEKRPQLSQLLSTCSTYTVVAVVVVPTVTSDCSRYRIYTQYISPDEVIWSKTLLPSRYYGTSAKRLDTKLNIPLAPSFEDIPQDRYYLSLLHRSLHDCCCSKRQQQLQQPRQGLNCPKTPRYEQPQPQARPKISSENDYLGYSPLLQA